MGLSRRMLSWTALTATTALVNLTVAYTRQLPPQRSATSYISVDIKRPFQTFMARMKAAQLAVQKRQADVLAERYDLTNRPATGATMARGKALLAEFRGTGAGFYTLPI
jgi:hypothetical protein